MKIAIIGSGPLGLYAASHFYNLGAHVVLFQRSPLGGNLRFCHSKKIEGNVDYPEKKTFEKFWNDDLVPLIEFVEEKGITKAGDVLRVHKRFLHRDEVVLNRSRLVDLFRVIFSVNPKESILKQVEENPDMFKQLGEDVLHSLHEAVESFEDFDIVIEATGRGKSDFKMGPAGTFALNEKNLSKHSHFYYGKEFFKTFNENENKKVVVVGDDVGAYLAVLKLEDWLHQSPDHKLTWVKHNPLHKDFFSMDNFLHRAETEFNQRKVEFEEKLHAWRALEDYEKAKIPRPAEPEKKFSLYEGYNVTSVDKLLDREGVFVTIESPEFRHFVENNSDLKTIPCDAIIVQNGVDVEETLADKLSIEEPGYYVLHSDSIKDGVLQILDIEKKVLNFFSKSDQ